MISYIWLVPLLPLGGSLFNALVGRLLGRRVVGIVGVGSVLVSFLISAAAFFELEAQPESARVFDLTLYNWIATGNFSVNLAFLYDPLSAVMLLVVTGVGLLIHVYSIGYMGHDEGYARFFVYLNLFVFSMLLLVLGDNYLVLYAGWELVGLCSYLLIGFWFTRSAARSAAVKAFVTTRIGDLFFSLGVILIWTTFGTLAYGDVFHLAAKYPVGAPIITAVTLLLFAGAVGKSAQLPLYVWLPDAMEGPTPVSALIHAATMVTAGVYMVARSHVLYELAPLSLEVVGTIGAVTALFAATIALVQTDLKRVLAYSTISQLGYMFLGAGVAAFGASIFHLMTHAFFKALLFLAAGSVMHAMNDVIDMRRLGGLARFLRVTYVTFVVGALALSGFPLLSGFFSKDEILASAFASGNYLLYGLGIVTAALTAFYSFRAVFLTFHGTPRWFAERGVKQLPDGRLFVETTHESSPAEGHAAHGHTARGAPHESPATMTLPLMLLALLAIVGGYVGLPAVLGPNWFGGFMASVFGPERGGLEGATEWIVLGISSLVALVGIGVAYWFYIANPALPTLAAADYPGVYKLLVNKYYVDQIYDTLFVRPGRQVAEWLWQIVDASIIDGAANGLARLFGAVSRGLRSLQVGYARAYAFAMVIGIVVVLAAFVLH